MDKRGRAVAIDEWEYQEGPEKFVRKGFMFNRPGTARVPRHVYEIQPLLPARRIELLDVAKAIHRDKVAMRVKRLFDPEREAAIQAIESGIYIGWRIPGHDSDCIRVGTSSLCFCGHALDTHGHFCDKSINNLRCLTNGCGCKQFNFVPSRPDEIGEWWLHKKGAFDVSSWRAICRCSHNHEQHDPNSRRCSLCPCFVFSSNFLCAACDKHWELHDTFFDDIESRRQKGLPYGEDFLPFTEHPQLRDMSLIGKENISSALEGIKNAPDVTLKQQPSELGQQLQDEDSRPDFFNKEY